MLAKELESKTIDELRKEVADLRKEQWNLKMEGRTGQSTRYSQFKKLRRDIARIYTVMNKKKKQMYQDTTR